MGHGATGHGAMGDGATGIEVLSPLEFLTRRLRGGYTVDPWGLDRDLLAVLAPITRARWRVDSTGLDLLPPDRGALLVHNRSWGWGEAAALVAAVHRATGRVVRMVGVPDLVVVQPLLRSLGVILDHPEEVQGVLGAGHLVAVGAGRERLGRRFAGAVSPEALAPAVSAGVPVLPVAVRPGQLGLRWTVTVGPASEAGGHHGPLALAELAEHTRAGLQALLDPHLLL